MPFNFNHDPALINGIHIENVQDAGMLENLSEITEMVSKNYALPVRGIDGFRKYTDAVQLVSNMYLGMACSDDDAGFIVEMGGILFNVREGEFYLSTVEASKLTTRNYNMREGAQNLHDVLRELNDQAAEAGPVYDFLKTIINWGNWLTENRSHPANPWIVHESEYVVNKVFAFNREIGECIDQDGIAIDFAMAENNEFEMSLESVTEEFFDQVCNLLIGNDREFNDDLSELFTCADVLDLFNSKTTSKITIGHHVTVTHNIGQPSEIVTTFTERELDGFTFTLKTQDLNR